jgi:hypothetical protein
MITTFKSILLVVLVSLWLSGCSHNELFSCIDRHCFIADWTNHYSCVSCCGHGSGSQQRCANCQ